MIEGVTEIRCGVYMFGDLFQVQIHSCAIEDLAVSVLATVIGHRRDPNRLIIHAGFGLVAEIASAPHTPTLRVDRVYQEHGVIELAGPGLLKKLPIGSRVRVLPNHVCLTAAMYDRYLAVDVDDTVRDT